MSIFNPDVECKKLEKISQKYSGLFDKARKSSMAKAAVLIAIFQYQSKPHVILTERSKSLRTHAGQVALPGGKMDRTDDSIQTAALREAEEEIGLRRDYVQVLGTSFPVYSSVAKTLVFPVVGFIRNIADVKLSINVGEVENVFAVPLEVFCETDQYTSFGEFRFPKVEWESHIYDRYSQTVHKDCETILKLFSLENKYVIWGITALILDIYSAIVLNRTPSTSTWNMQTATSKEIHANYLGSAARLLVGKL